MAMLMTEPLSMYTLSVELQALEDIPGWLVWQDDPFVAPGLPETASYIDRLKKHVRASGLLSPEIQVSIDRRCHYNMVSNFVYITNMLLPTCHT